MTSSSPSKEVGPRIKIGVILSAHGIRGAVRVLVLSSDPEKLFSYTDITDATGKRGFTFTRHSIKDKCAIATIKGIPDRNAAELLKGVELFAIEAEEVTEEGKWSHKTLTGMEARLVDGNVYGRVIGVYNFGAGDILEIERGDGTTEMLPFNDGFFGDVQPDEGSLVVYPPDYLEAK